MIHHGQGPRQNSLLLIGAGRLARHLHFYFSQLEIPFETWNRKESLSVLHGRMREGQTIALAISDDAIPGFVASHLRAHQGKIVHFSGALNLPGLISAHPLMSFGPTFYPKDFYPQIHFTLTGAESLSEVIPGLPNSFTPLSADKKALYHSLCVMGGNFPVLLWDKMETNLKEWGFPQEAIRLYIQRVAANYIENGAKALTGPLVRKDFGTIEKNILALQQDPWLPVYEAFKEVLL